MKPVLRLVRAFFMATLPMRVLTFSGLVLMMVSGYLLVTHPKPGEKFWIAMLGVMAFFLGSSLMPSMVGRLARSHAIGVLPGGRFKLLASAFLTTVIVAIPVGVLSPAGFMAGLGLQEIIKAPGALEYLVQLALISFTSAMLFAGWLYLAIWFMSNEPNLVGGIKALLVVAVLMFAPARELRDLTMTASWNLLQIAVVWILFGAVFLLWPRYKARRARGATSRRGFTLLGFRRSTAGREIDLMLGTSNPWLLIGSQALPILIATQVVHDLLAIWLFYLVIFSTVAGAIAGEAAARSRALWLRGNWSRETLFAQVERSFWRHNAYVLGSLVLVLLCVGIFGGLPAKVLVVGVPLLMLGTILSTYLGLMVTRGVRWIEGFTGAGVMLTLMAVAIFIIERQHDLVAILMIEGGLAVLAFLLRSMARRRWMQLDWMECRRARATMVRDS